MSTELQEYTDELTGIRLTVERDGPYQEHPRISAIAPLNGTLSTEHANEAVRRLLVMAGLKQPGQTGGQQS